MLPVDINKINKIYYHILPQNLPNMVVFIFVETNFLGSLIAISG